MGCLDATVAYLSSLGSRWSAHEEPRKELKIGHPTGVKHLDSGAHPATGGIQLPDSGSRNEGCISKTLFQHGGLLSDFLSVLITVYEFVGDGVSIRQTASNSNTSVLRLSGRLQNVFSGSPQAPMVPPLSPRSPSGPRPPEQPLRSDDLGCEQPEKRYSMDYNTTWKDLPLHEGVSKPRAAAHQWPSKDFDREGSKADADTHAASESTTEGQRNETIGTSSDSNEDDHLKADSEIADRPVRQETPNELRALGSIAKSASPTKIASAEGHDRARESAGAEASKAVQQGAVVRRGGDDRQTSPDEQDTELEDVDLSGKS
ncbi:MAG: hypothetical protein Q9159_001555 [Coniocarpon cinnabarinum]